MEQDNICTDMIDIDWEDVGTSYGDPRQCYTIPDDMLRELGMDADTSGDF